MVLVGLVEGPWDKVHRVIGQAHTVLHQQGVVRIQSDIRSGSRYVFLLFCFWGLTGLMFGQD